MTDIRRIGSIYRSEQFARFVLVGSVAAFLHWLSRLVINSFVSFSWAVILAYPVGIIVAFTLNKLYVFPYSRRSLTFEIFFFLLVNILAFPVVWTVAYILGELVFSLWMPRQIALAVAHGVAIAVPVVVSFVINKFITFAEA